jgi:hypothetical protein
MGKKFTYFKAKALDLTKMDGLVGKTKNQIHESVDKKFEELKQRVRIKVKVFDLTHEELVRTSKTIVEVPYDTFQKRVALSALPFVHMSIPLVSALHAQLANLEAHLKDLSGPEGLALIERFSRIVVTIAPKSTAEGVTKEMSLD